MSHRVLPFAALRSRALRLAVILSAASVIEACGGTTEKPTAPPPPVVTAASVTIQGAPTGIVLAGDSAVLTATVLGTTGATLTNRTIAWSSSVATVASVSGTGTVRALRDGVTTITATVDGVVASVRFDVSIGGRLSSSATVISSADSSIVLTIPEDVNRGPAVVVARALPDSLGDSRTVPGTIFSIGPDSTPTYLFTLELKYDPTRLPSAVAGESLQIYLRTPRGWVQQLFSSADVGTRRVKAVASLPGVYAVRSTPVSRIVLNGPHVAGGLFSGSRSSIGYELYDAANARLLNRPLQWASSDPSIIRVQGSEIFAERLGTATITASTDGASASTTVTSIIGPATSFDGAADWVTFQGNFLHNGFVSATVNPSAARLLWRKTPFEGSEMLQPTVVGNRVFVTMTTVEDGTRLMAFDATTGATLWTFVIPEFGTMSQPTWSAGRLYVVTSDADSRSTLVALNETDGSVIYRGPVVAGMTTTKAPAIAGTTIGVAALEEGGMLGLDRETGAQRYYRPGTVPFVSWVPSVQDSTFIVSDRGIQVVDARTGVTRRSLPDERLTPTTMVGAPPLPFLGITTNGFFSAFPSSGTDVYIEDDSFQFVPVTNGLVTVTLRGNKVEQRNIDGRVRWTFTHSDVCDSEPRSIVLTRNLVFMSCAQFDGPPGGETVAIDINTGLPVWSYPMGGHLALSSRGVLYITTDSTITAIRFSL